MGIDNPEALAFLQELLAATGGGAGVQASMYEVGHAVGLEKGAAATLAEELMVEGWVELVTLAGGISITPEGLKLLGGDGTPAADAPILPLGGEPVLGEDGRRRLETLIDAVKTGLAGCRVPYAVVEEMVIDLKTIEVQLLSPAPKTGVIREVLRSLALSVAAAGMTDIAAGIEALIG